MTEAARSHRRTFAPVLLLGLVGAALAAFAGNRVWAEATDDAAVRAGATAFAEADAQMPLVSALSLVVLACWGVVLVTRGRVRRAVAGLGAVAAVATLVTVAVGYVAVPRAVADEYAGLGFHDAAITHTGWFWVAGVGAVLSAVATVAAVLWAPSWPEMGSRYDAPGAAKAPAVPPEDQSSLDLWKAMDEGRDPTA